MQTWTIYEPSWWKNFMLFLNDLVSSNQFIFKFASICADAVVFLFPIILLWFYLYGYKNNQLLYKKGSIKILLWIIIAIIVTILTQQFVWKDRPESLPWLDLILAHVPTMSFPSDHATVWFAMWMGSILFGLMIKRYLNNTKIYNRSILLLILIILMVLSRVAVAIHWTTDIIAGAVIWAICAYIAYRFKLFEKLSNWIVSIIDRILSIFWEIQ